MFKLKFFGSAFVLPSIDKWDKGEQARDLRMFLQDLGVPRIRFHDWGNDHAFHLDSCNSSVVIGVWKDLKTMQFYIRKAGVDTAGISDAPCLHNPAHEPRILNMMYNSRQDGFKS